jgi:hypothetical protein
MSVLTTNQVKLFDINFDNLTIIELKTQLKLIKKITNIVMLLPQMLTIL